MVGGGSWVEQRRPCGLAKAACPAPCARPSNAALLPARCSWRHVLGALDRGLPPVVGAAVQAGLAGGEEGRQRRKG
nr:unnamed protein product [Digitaria exilis]